MDFCGIIGAESVLNSSPKIEGGAVETVGAKYLSLSSLSRPSHLWYRPDDDAGAVSHAGTVWLVWVKGLGSAMPA